MKGRRRRCDSCDSIGVIWFYERKGEHLRCEIRQLIEGDKFALVVTMPDGSERTELFDDGGALNRRSIELEQMLRTKGWNGPYAAISQIALNSVSAKRASSSIHCSRAANPASSPISSICDGSYL